MQEGCGVPHLIRQAESQAKEPITLAVAWLSLATTLLYQLSFRGASLTRVIRLLTTSCLFYVTRRGPSLLNSVAFTRRFIDGSLVF